MSNPCSDTSQLPKATAGSHLAQQGGLHDNNLPRVVIVIEGGIVQTILADKSHAVEIIVKDYDTEGMGKRNSAVYLDDSGSAFSLREGPDQVDAAEVARCYAELTSPANHWLIEVGSLSGCNWGLLVDVDDEKGDRGELVLTADRARAKHFEADEVDDARGELSRRFPDQRFRLLRNEPTA